MMTASDKQLATNVAQALRQRRVDSGLTLEGLASRAGLHRTSLGLIERGERHLTLASAKRLADALGCSLWELVKDAEDAAG
jgi:transcriptional regulator with XRE-family HTH domain